MLLWGWWGAAFCCRLQLHSGPRWMSLASELWLLHQVDPHPESRKSSSEAPPHSSLGQQWKLWAPCILHPRPLKMGRLWCEGCSVCPCR